MPRNTGLTPARFAAQGLSYHWRVNGSILLGIIVGTAVLTGALVVGDSVRNSLRQLTLERLGRIDRVLVADHFFSPSVVTKLDLTARPLAELDSAIPAVLISKTAIQSQSQSPRRRAGQVGLIGCDETFWSLDTTGTRPVRQPTGREIVLNAPLAETLGAKIGDRVVLRLPNASRVAGDSPLGEKTDRVQNIAELEVIDIIPAEGLGRFSLRPNQALPHTAFVAMKTVQSALDKGDLINAIFVASSSPRSTTAADEVIQSENAELAARAMPTLDDAGIHLDTVRLGFWDEATSQTKTSHQYESLATDTMMFSPSMEQAIGSALAGVDHQPVFTYLANAIEKSETNDAASRSIPYSTVSALSAQTFQAIAATGSGAEVPALAKGELALNSWAAKELNAVVGDKIRVRYFAPETTHGQPEEATAEFVLRRIIELTEPLLPYENGEVARYVDPPQFANDPSLTPAVPGITDQDSIDGWDPPFPFDYSRIRDQDEAYWDQYRTTPKAFISLADGRRLWGSRFGETTSFRIAADNDASRDDVRDRIQSAISDNVSAFGFGWLALRNDGLKASRGTTPFNVLFLGFSSFIIAAAVMLVSLLFRLSLEQRASEAGLLLAAGLPQRQVLRLFLRQGLVLAILGAVLGTLLGVGYAALMMTGLRTWWLDAVVTPFLRLHVRPTSLVIGALAGGIICYITIRWTLSKFTRLTVRQLMSRQLQPPHRKHSAGGRRRAYLLVGLWGVALASAIAATFLSGEAQAGAFFGGGASTLAALLVHTSNWLRRTPREQAPTGLSMSQLVVKNIGRNPLRSVLTIGLMATACFLIVAISAFRLAPTDEGTGGFQLLGQADIAIFDNLDDPQIRSDLLGSAAEALNDVQILGLRMVDGDDASCRNLYQASRPQILGVTPVMLDSADRTPGKTFGWAKTAAATEAERANPWRLLTDSGDDRISVILDKNTAMYGLQLYGGVGEEFELDYGERGVLSFRVAGLLANSVLQGSLLTSEASLLKHFPDVSGYRFFLVDCEAAQADEVKAVLEDGFSDQGLQLTNTRELLRDLLAVQNTYLSTFQSLGGLGLMLGTLGLVAVQLRNVFERRRELALLRATGFSRQRISQLVMTEHFTLLLWGLVVGLLAALVAVLPHGWSTNISTPWRTLASVFALILIVGLGTGYFALRPATRTPLVTALRDD